MNLVFKEYRTPHIHLEYKTAASAFNQAQVFRSSAGGDGDRVGGVARIDEQCSDAARAVAGDFWFASIRVEQANGRVTNQDPTIGADAGMAIANRSGYGRQVRRA